ncbi:hypothetical protein [Dendronalium sp. ChiSLP03b]|uniref:hypothetical protein n=1 Tax=Dendronalium sp. ChiSLP03b TaxID=3075381 RepID=UPI002AD27D0D|nr:hypothetical protein [Dendronalium sp. ChiSLP03b]MDZ8208596.1 hypothetical protein [Dendronalium sp. ChiSLP03b]
MTSIPQPFAEAENDWDLANLYQDLTSAKQQIASKPKQLTQLEKTCLRGLLCGYGPNEIAAAINREVRGLRVDLSRGLYRYIEVLTQRPSNTLKDWREVADWLAKANYKTSLSHTSLLTSDSLIKIVDVSLEGSANSPVIDLKVRNIGNQVAFLKNTKFLFYNSWLLKSWLLPEAKNMENFALPAAAPMQRSRVVLPSYDYQVPLPAPANFDLSLPINLFAENYLNANPKIVYIEDFKISQCVSCNDVDRFTFTFSLPENYHQLSRNIKTQYLLYTSYIYHLKLELIYDEDDKSVQSTDLVILLESEFAENLDKRVFFAESDSKLPAEIQEISQHNQQLVTEIAQIKGIRSSLLNSLLKKITF